MQFRYRRGWRGDVPVNAARIAPCVVICAVYIEKVADRSRPSVRLRPSKSPKLLLLAGNVVRVGGVAIVELAKAVRNLTPLFRRLELMMLGVRFREAGLAIMWAKPSTPY